MYRQGIHPPPPRNTLLEDQAPIVVDDTLRKVDVPIVGVPLAIPQLGSEDRELLWALDGQVDVLRRSGEAFAAPVEGTCFCCLAILPL
jgi:hypothetical protein